MKSTPSILINTFYSEITPESAEHGEFSDCGELEQNLALSFSELVSFIRRNGFAKDSESARWLSTNYFVNDYRTLTERQETLHFSSANEANKKKWFDLAARVAAKK